MDQHEQLDWELHSVDASVIRAHQYTAGAKKTSPDEEALGRSRGGFNTKVHLRTDHNGRLMHLVLTPGQRHEATQVEALFNGGAVKRAGPGRPKKRPKRLAGD